ncbi:MAG: methyl-accepting chemotaxis protein, partial [Treponema sp.]|nr:methyl-accepting chemotaxis protein [Treponema sp.]
MKLKIRLSLIVTLLLTIAVSSISIILLLQARSMQIKAAYENLENMTGLYSAVMQNRYENYLVVAKTLAEIMNSYRRVPVTERRTRYDDIMSDIMESNPNFWGIFTLWNPNVLDGRDAEFANMPGTDTTGRYMSWYTRRSGPIEKRPLITYELYKDVIADMDRAEPLLSSPYFLNSAGKRIIVTRICYPIIGNDNVIVGRVGIMVDFTSSSAAISEIRPFGTGSAILYAHDGTIAAHHDSSMVGKKIRDKESLSILGESLAAKLETSLETGKPVSGKYNGYIFESYPFHVGNISVAWTLLTSVPENTVLSTVTQLTEITIIIVAAAVLITVLIIFFVAGSIAKPIVNVALTLKDISEGEGDLTRTIPVHGKGEIADLSVYFNKTLEKIKILIVTIKNQAVALFDIGNELASNMTETAAAINEITANIQSIKGRVINQSASVTETNATMEQITVNIDKLNGHVENQTSSV